MEPGGVHGLSGLRFAALLGRLCEPAENNGNCSTEYVTTGGALRRAAASGGGVVCGNFVMLSVPPKVGSDAPSIPRPWPVRWAFLKHR